MKAIIGSRALRGERQNRKARQARKPEGTKKVSQLGGYSPPPQTGGGRFPFTNAETLWLVRRPPGTVGGYSPGNGFFKKPPQKCTFRGPDGLSPERGGFGGPGGGPEGSRRGFRGYPKTTPIFGPGLDAPEPIGSATLKENTPFGG